MNDNETLTKLVEQAIKGDGYIFSKLVTDDINERTNLVGWSSGHKLEVLYNTVHGADCTFKYTFSLSDLLFNHPFMQSACGGICALHKTSFVCVVERQQICRWGGHLDYKACPHYGAIGVMHNLVPLPTDPERLKYVRDNILEVK